MLFKNLVSARSSSPITYVGGVSASSTSTSYNISLSGTLSGGIATSPSVGDIIIVVSATGGTNIVPTCSGNNTGTYNYITGTSSQYQTETVSSILSARFKIQSSVDTTLTVTQDSSASSRGGATAIQVWRYVDSTTPFNSFTPLVIKTINATNIQFSAVSGVSSGSVILACGSAAQGFSGSVFSAPTNMTGPTVSVNGNGSGSDHGVIISSHNWPGSSFTPNSITTWATNSTYASIGMVLVLKSN